MYIRNRLIGRLILCAGQVVHRERHRQRHASHSNVFKKSRTASHTASQTDFPKTWTEALDRLSRYVSVRTVTGVDHIGEGGPRTV